MTGGFLRLRPAGTVDGTAAAINASGRQRSVKAAELLCTNVDANAGINRACRIALAADNSESRPYSLGVHYRCMLLKRLGGELAAAGNFLCNLRMAIDASVIPRCGSL